ncbi:hypothetical protein [Zhihengliuella halotolerans]|uniref:Uncharacterized protein n=1 Tax=Zhihengliuella halotolerans TaxID=370736 RepID=A0A4Q8AC59_9MICC|nr:hypothetical protein [Zhihengliuella halotolerans]RZU61772.1 hypothetical protein EV380_1350 [Zhihengliuella halotolerans]
MSSYGTGLAGFLRDVEDVLEQYRPSADDDWMTQANRTSLEALRDEVQGATLEVQKGFRAHFEHGAIQGHAGPANQILKAMVALNDAVVALVNRNLAEPYKTITDNIREKLGLWVVPATAGSVVMELVCPPATAVEEREPSHRPIDGQTAHPIIDDQTPAPTASTIDEVLSVLRATVDHEPGDDLELENALVDIGYQATAAMRRFAERCIELGATIEISDRTPTSTPVTVRTQDAQYLKSTIKTLGLEEEPLIVEGEWVTGSDVRDVFDLRKADGTYIKGRLPKQLIMDSAAAYKKFVQAEIQIIHRGGVQGQQQHVLQKITVLADTVPADFFDAPSEPPADS